ncbi:MAG: hypothetical protein ACSLFB_02855 [Acidimicrobiales bacterium]
MTSELIQILRSLAVHDSPAFGEAVDEAFAWATFLSKADRELFIEELTKTLMGAGMVENYYLVTQLLREWKATAEVHADPKLARRLRKSIEATGGVVSTPSS